MSSDMSASSSLSPGALTRAAFAGSAKTIALHHVMRFQNAWVCASGPCDYCGRGTEFQAVLGETSRRFALLFQRLRCRPKPARAAPRENRIQLELGDPMSSVLAYGYPAR